MANSLRPRLRVLHHDVIALGPGKVELLEALDRAGTLAEAARQVGMSYMRAWSLVQTMNACFREPLVQTARGGTGRGSATLSDTGRAVLELYRRMEREAAEAVEPAWQELERYLEES